MRYTVLTYIINNYEKVHEIQKKDPEAEYLLITDNQDLTSNTWTIVYDKDLEGLSTFDKCYAIRFNCFKYCNTDICLRIDGNIKVLNSLKPIIDVFEKGNYDAALMPHPINHNLIEEYKLWIKWRGYDKAQAERCIESMCQRGYDFDYKGMFQCCFSIQRRGELTNKIDKMTLDYLKELGTNNEIERIDQIPFSYIMNTYFNNLKVLPVSEQIIRSYYLQWYKHNSNIKNNEAFYDIKKEDIKYMFNQPVQCMYANAPMQELVVLDSTDNNISLPKGKTIAVHVHCFYTDLAKELSQYLNNIPLAFDLFISVPEGTKSDTSEIRNIFKDITNVKNITISITPNVGRDIAPLLCQFGKEMKGYDFIAHFHTKKTIEDISLKDWRRHILSHLLGTENLVAQILNNLNCNTGMIAPSDYSSCWDTTGWSANIEAAQKIIDLSNLNIELEKDYPVIYFPQGTMFWARTDFLKHFFDLPLSYQDFPKEPIERDGTIAHALERLFFVWGRDTDMNVQKVFRSQWEKDCWAHMKTMMINRQQELFDILPQHSAECNSPASAKKDKTKKHLKAIRLMIWALSFAFILILSLIIALICK